MKSFPRQFGSALALLLLCLPALAQDSSAPQRSGNTLPASCTNTRVTFNLLQTDGANAPGLYRCNGSVFVPVGGAAGSGSQVVMWTMVNVTVGAGLARYTAPASQTVAPSSGAQAVALPAARTVSNLVILTSGTQPADGPLTVTVYKNGTATALTLTVPANAAGGVFTDSTHAVSFAAGDKLSIQLDNTVSGSASANILSLGFVAQ